MSGTCPDDNQLARYVARQLGASARAKIEEHLDGCSQCLQAVVLMARDTSLGGTVADRPQTPPRETGVVAGRYRIDDLLGEGGMGTVYLAFDTKLERPVALKVVREGRVDREQSHTRMEREAKAMAKLAHPNVVTVFDTGMVGDRVYIAMELVEGVTLDAWLTQTRRTNADIVRTFCNAGEGLAAAHAVGVVHRDFKPQNVLVGRNGRVAVTDFGLASETAGARGPVLPENEAAAPHLTNAGAILGTPHYMSPEQRKGESVDARSDQFSFALSLEEALGTSSRAPPRLRRALRRALAEEAKDRFPSLEALLLELRPFARASRWRARAPLVLLGIAVLVALGGAFSYRRARDANAANHAVTLLDLPMPTSTVPAALDAYHEAVVEQHDGVRGSYRLFQSAAGKDPQLGTAYLRHAMIELSTDDPDRHAASLEAFRHAVDARERLSARDRGVLDALSPALLGQPADWATCEKRVWERIALTPMDENLVVTLGQVLAIEGKLADADTTYAHAIELDPHDLGVRALRADEQLVRGDLESAAATASTCIDTNPRATRCVGTLFSVRSIQGRCHDTQALSQRLITLRPDDIWGYLDLHESELALGEPDETVIATEEQLIAHSPPSDRTWARLHYPWLRAVLEGDFARASALIDEEVALAVQQGSLADELRALNDTAMTAAETGDAARAARAADRYLKRKKALPPPTYVTRNVIAREHVPTMIALAQRGKLLSADDARRARDAWLDEWRGRLAGRESAYLWLQAYAMPSETQAEAEEALAHAPGDLGPLFALDELEVETVGRLYAQVGRFAEAIPLLESASRQCRVRRFPFAIVRASYLLGIARERLGDRAAACEAYGRVTSRWGKAGKMKSITAAQAAARAQAIGCPTSM